MDYTYQVNNQAPVVHQGNPIFFLIFLVVFIALYCYLGYSLYVMAKKTNVPDPWMAWIPLLNAYIIIKIAGKPGWWFFLLLIPLLNIIIVFVVWYNAALRLNKPGWYGILTCIIPLFIFLLASPYKTTPTATPTAMPLN